MRGRFFRVLSQAGCLGAHGRGHRFFLGGDRRASRWPTRSNPATIQTIKVVELDGLSIPVGISPACARIQRILESEGLGFGRYIQVSVKRKSAWGIMQTSHVNLWMDPMSDGEGEEDAWSVVESSSSSESDSDDGRGGRCGRMKKLGPGVTVVRGSRPNPPQPSGIMSANGAAAGSGAMSGPQQLFMELSGLVTDAIDSVIT